MYLLIKPLERIRYIQESVCIIGPLYNTSFCYLGRLSHLFVCRLKKSVCLLPLWICSYFSAYLLVYLHLIRLIYVCKVSNRVFVYPCASVRIPPIVYFSVRKQIKKKKEFFSVSTCRPTSGSTNKPAVTHSSLVSEFFKRLFFKVQTVTLSSQTSSLLHSQDIF